MQLTCPECDSECLDQGINKKILCHDCGTFFELTKSVQNPLYRAEV